RLAFAACQLHHGDCLVLAALTHDAGAGRTLRQLDRHVVAQAHQHVDFLASRVHGARRAVTHLGRAPFEEFVGSRPAGELAPKAVVILVADLVAPAPGAVNADEEHATLAVGVPGDYGLAVLARKNRGCRLWLANDAP